MSDSTTREPANDPQDHESRPGDRRVVSRLWSAMGACVAVMCGYGMLLALGVFEFGITHLVLGPAAALALLCIGAVWEERALPAIGKVVKRIWPGYDGDPAPLT